VPSFDGSGRGWLARCTPHPRATVVARSNRPLTQAAELSRQGKNDMRTLALVFVAAVAVGCVRTRTDPATGRTDVDVESPAKRGEDWSGQLTGRGMHTAVSGTVRAQSLDGRTTITVQLQGDTPNNSRAWALHEGRCDTPGPMVGGTYDFPALRIAADGRASATATLQNMLNEAKSYYVAVHASASDMATVIACGELDD
jgi:hypothetical protein